MSEPSRPHVQSRIDRRERRKPKRV